MSEPVKSKNQIKNEEKKKAKLAKLAAKLEKQKLEAENKKNNGNSSKKNTVLQNQEVFVNKTPFGEKKNMDTPMSSAYNPQAVEAAWYAWWEKSGFFKPEYQTNPDAEKFVIPIPPPNVTGSLHVGHAMMTAIQDTLVRWHRMCGKTVLYVPGCDHAGISTQVVVEKKLAREKNLLKYDLGREAFVEEIWKWKKENGDRIYDQFRRLGISVDWDRARFTLDAKMNNAVNEAFVRLYDDGLIFRANRLVHWSAKIQTSVSDLEVDHKTVPGRSWLLVPGCDKKYEFGVLTKVAYKVEGFDDEIIVATTRPETIIGDTALAVNPNDSRYLKFHGKFAINPITEKRIPIVTDEHADMEFGTGALKITPAHDYNDFEIGKRHNLEFINIFDENNIVTAVGGKFAGLPRFEARVAVVNYLKEIGLHRGDEGYEIVLPICNRSGDIIEPRLKSQWWLDCKDMAAKAVEAVKSKELSFVPEEAEKTWFFWLENIRDWCVSRQLWWGHRIPAYQVKIRGDTEEHWVIGRNLEEVWERVQKRFPDVAKEDIELTQDEDVLDTWFSSGLWPFSIFDWPHNTSDFMKYYPTTVLETGRDIIFFWVARMVMFGQYFTGQLPFKTILLHSIVRDAIGRKMSKSLGNVIDPLDVIEGITLEGLHGKLLNSNFDKKEIETVKKSQKKDFPNGIPQCGSDALRFALCASMSFTRDINLDILRVEGYRKFCNKIWNATKFALMKLEGFAPPAARKLTGSESLADCWILSRLNSTAQEVNKAFSENNFMVATNSTYAFFLYDLCDNYLEVIKPIFANSENHLAKSAAQNALYDCLEGSLKLLHPLMPYLTEELYQRLPRRKDDSIPSICVSSYPVYSEEFHNMEAEETFGKVKSIAHKIRGTAAEQKLSKDFSVTISVSADKMTLIQSQKDYLTSMIKGMTSLNITEHESEELQVVCEE